jgi:hypothetical protein
VKLEELVDKQAMPKSRVHDVIIAFTPTFLMPEADVPYVMELVAYEPTQVHALLFHCDAPRHLSAWLGGSIFDEGAELPLFPIREIGESVGSFSFSSSIQLDKGNKLVVRVSSKVTQQLMVALSGVCVRAGG